MIILSLEFTIKWRTDHRSGLLSELLTSITELSNIISIPLSKWFFQTSIWVHHPFPMKTPWLSVTPLTWHIRPSWTELGPVSSPALSFIHLHLNTTIFSLTKFFFSSSSLSLQSFTHLFPLLGYSSLICPANANLL